METQTQAPQTKERATYADYQALPEGAPYQLIDGELVMAPSPTRFHQIASGELEFLLRTHVKEHDLGDVYDAPFDVKFSDTETYQPDIVFVSHARRAILTDAGVEGAPDLVMEVLSPSTGYYDLTHKKRVYAAADVREYWLVDPQERRIEVHTNRDGTFAVADEAQDDGAVASSLLDGFSVALGDIFPW